LNADQADEDYMKLLPGEFRWWSKALHIDAEWNQDQLVKGNAILNKTAISKF
jgi:hypothetical protein